MPTPLSARRSHLVAAPLGVVFEAALSLPLPQLYRRRFGPIPPIVAVRDQQGPWERPGQTRVFVTADRGEMHEEMRSLDPPHGFANRLTVLKGPFRPVVRTVEESWTFRAVGEGTEATWEWEMHPRSALTRLVVPLLLRLWLGYARGVQEQLAEEVTRAGS